jgi:hypothetical protein
MECDVLDVGVEGEVEGGGCSDEADGCIDGYAEDA